MLSEEQLKFIKENESNPGHWFDCMIRDLEVLDVSGKGYVQRSFYSNLQRLEKSIKQLISEEAK